MTITSWIVGRILRWPLISQDELVKAFGHADRDSDGWISVEELIDAVKELRG